MPEQPLAFGSPEDPESCFALCTEVRNRIAPEDYAMLTSYAPLPARRGESYLPLTDTESHWPTSYIVQIAEPLTEVVVYPDGGHKHMVSHKWYGYDFDEERQDGERGRQLLVVSGKRQIVIPQAHAQLPYTGGVRDCYVEWLPLSGEEFPPMSLIADYGSTRVNHVKHGAGALITRTAVFDAGGKEDGFQTTFVILEAALYFGPPDNIKVDLYGHTYTHANERDPIEPPKFLYGVHMAWVDTFHRARAGFNEHCMSWPEIAEAERQQYVMLRNNSGTDRQAFKEWTVGREWVEVFDAVEEAWQLIVACQLLEPKEFAHRRTANKRGRDMVQAYASLRPERATHMARLWETAKPVLLEQSHGQ